MMEAKYIQSGTAIGSQRLEVFGAPFGAVKGHAHYEKGIATGSNIPAGLFVSYSPIYVSDEFGDCTEKSFILPHVTGEMLHHNIRTQTFADSIDAVLVDGKFKFAGVSTYAGDTCKRECAMPECCPTGYMEPQHNNYTERLKATKIVTQGMVRVFNSSDVSVTDDLHVVVDQLDGEPCMYIGSVVNAAGDNTQPLDIDYRITENSKAGEGVWIELGRK